MNESNQFERVCKAEFQEINEKLDKISNRLFVDNGGESFQSRLNRHDRLLKFAMKALTVIVISLIGFAIFVAQEAYKDWRMARYIHPIQIAQPAGPQTQE